KDQPFPESLCHRCAAPPRYVRTARSVFIFCPLLPERYPRQPVIQCTLFRPLEDAKRGKNPGDDRYRARATRPCERTAVRLPIGNRRQPEPVAKHFLFHALRFVVECARSKGKGVFMAGDDSERKNSLASPSEPSGAPGGDGNEALLVLPRRDFLRF